MKVKLLSRNPDDYIRETTKDIHKVPRNYDPKLHPMAAPREYTRAMNAVKLERVFAKPFLGSLDGHKDGITCLSKHPQKLSMLFSGGCDGEVRIWNIPKKKCLTAIQAHDGFVRGICFNTANGYFYTCGDDKVIKQWSLENLDAGTDPMNSIHGKTSFNGMDHHRTENFFLTCGHQMDLWNEERVEPVWSCKGVNTSTCVKFNPSEVNYAAATYMDRSIALFDIRQHQTIRKVVLKMVSNSLSWNPMEPFYFTVANEDYNLYSFDMRKLDMPTNIHKDHTAAVLDIDYSPTGKEFVSGSYDKSIRIFPSLGGHSRDIYHTKRMQRVACVQWSPDSKFVFSASEEMNIRIWKANASEKLGILKPREKEAFNYAEALKEKYANHPQIRRIARHRHVPRHIYTAAAENRIIQTSQKRKEANKRAHSKPGTVPYVPERKKKVVAEVE